MPVYLFIVYVLGVSSIYACSVSSLILDIQVSEVFHLVYMYIPGVLVIDETDDEYK